MKRKEKPDVQDTPASFDESQQENRKSKETESAGETDSRQEVFLVEDGKLKPFIQEDYTKSTLYQVVEAFSVECRLVRPEDPGNLVIEGKKPSKKTVPAIVSRNGNCVLLESWESLEIKPELLADAQEVIGVTPVKQVFVLKRK